ncbi:MAG: hypothetical protein JSS02_35190 [Planctomycetes bacterium]|nr:hypothetical protein [Planctomycetota bacterium]
MLKTFKHAMLTCVAVASALLASASSASAGIVVDEYYQGVFTYGYDPFDSSANDSITTGPLSTSSSNGYADITSSETTATRIAYSYSVGLNGNFDNFGYAYAYQDVFFHVTADTSFAYNLSAFDLASRASFNYAYLIDNTTSTYIFENPFPDNELGAGFTFSGILLAGHDYEFHTFAEPVVYGLYGSTAFEMTGSSALTLVPEPSAFALSSLLLGAFGVTGMVKRFKRNAAAVEVR